MAITKKQQIRGVRILLTVFYGFLLSTILFSYLIHGTIETIRRPTNAYAIAMIVLGGIILISIALATYATWFDNTIIMLVSGIVLICVFILTLVFGIIRILNEASRRTVTIMAGSSNSANRDSLAGDLEKFEKPATMSDSYTLAEDVTKLIVELLFILFAILGTFILFRYVKTKYNAVPTAEPKPT